MENKYTYQDAFLELQQIVAEIEEGEVSVDELSAKISRASSLLAICKAKLTDSEKEVEKLLEKLDKSDAISE
ncbi:exodeoxyribonuclease VII small subunit [Sphingobacterium sp. DK4209]|uniref:Exodeoxyribonuclease 7 small subunit n=1 Tax=Sphingobacterium zhuxiongii TaxID=2662364 RepID=A0A5Q0Q6F0_9SPHI|nr:MULTISPECIES: exodeoxyribonuclease VII small subunit [unclassified Sphingobacterium]MVZ67306.1 exodeoxyribonuclease VII small subunit [Sphingobacterium sp. DK4209]QGA25043.1 exodeoxyribonuclease VII small subunit [Sphingobacterium sp. dk4302]